MSNDAGSKGSGSTGSGSTGSGSTGSGSTVRTLTSPPSLPRLYATSLLPSVSSLPDLPSVPVLSKLPGWSKLPSLSGLPGVSGGEPVALPDLEVALPDFSVNRDELAEYDRVCQIRLTDTLPATYLHILAFPLSVELMTDRSFPFPLVGLVHLANRITQHRPVGLDEKLALRVRTGRLRPQDKGTQFDVLAEVRVGDELVWTGESSYLRRGPAAGDTSGLPSSLPGDTVPDDPTVPQDASKAKWEVPTDIGRRYGKVSGDVNPIHLHPWAAKAFGFPRHIAHGMWSHARALGAFEGKLPDAFVADVRFQKPLLLPATVEFLRWEDDKGSDFVVRGTDKPTPHVSGTIRARSGS